MKKQVKTIYRIYKASDINVCVVSDVNKERAIEKANALFPNEALIGDAMSDNGNVVAFFANDIATPGLLGV